MIIYIILPTQLFPLSYYEDTTEVCYCLIEDKIMFSQFKYHKMKLVLHRASMKKYYDNYLSKRKRSKYIEFHENEEKIFDNCSGIVMYDPYDDMVLERWQKLCKRSKLSLKIIDSPMFLLNRHDDISKEIKHDSFYKIMRTRTGVLMNNDNKPKGGKFSYDTLNRKVVPKNQEHILPSLPKNQNCKYVQEAKRYVNKHFSKNPGSYENFVYAIDRKTALEFLDSFCQDKISLFGDYQDSLYPSNHPFLFHSILSPALNIGLILDLEVVQKIEKINVKINNIEGFIRQIIGWKQYVMWIYCHYGNRIKEMNFLKHTRKIPSAFWNGTTGMPPVDNVIMKIMKWGYAHHIERLMVVGQWLLLMRCDPKEVYEWFMMFFVDSYDVFMVANVFGMVCFADGGKYVMKRPYISTSKYLIRMGNYKPSEKYIQGISWAEIWDSLFYLFIDDHQNVLQNNYSLAPHVNRWKNKNNIEKNKIRKTAQEYFKYIFSKS